MNRKFCGTDGLFVAISIGDNYLSFKEFLYITNPVRYYALVTKENETYYFNDSDLNKCLRVCTFNECLDSLIKDSGY